MIEQNLCNLGGMWVIWLNFFNQVKFVKFDQICTIFCRIVLNNFINFSQLHEICVNQSNWYNVIKSV